MPVGLGIGVSHAPGMYLSTQEDWDNLWNRLSVGRGIPQPGYVAQESGAQLQDNVRRIKAAHGALRKALDDYDPEIVIIIGGDQTETFDRSNVPQLMLYLGEEVEAFYPGPMPQPGEERKSFKLKVHQELSEQLLKKLVRDEGFDIAFGRNYKTFGRAQGHIPHAFANPASYLIAESQIPTVLFYENTYDPPSLTAQRCYDLGASIAKLLKNDPRRIAILGSGGLAHDPGGKRSGWLDQPLDHWFLEKIADGRGRDTTAMFTFDSDTMTAGTGEVRAWITVAGAMEAMGANAKVLDYVEAAKTVTGLGFAYWEADKAAA